MITSTIKNVPFLWMELRWVSLLHWTICRAQCDYIDKRARSTQSTSTGYVLLQYASTLDKWIPRADSTVFIQIRSMNIVQLHVIIFNISIHLLHSNISIQADTTTGRRIRQVNAVCYVMSKTLIPNKCTKRVLLSIVTHSYMFRPCWVIFRENFCYRYTKVALYSWVRMCCWLFTALLFWRH
jgi:hypothetical protein